MNYKKSIEKIEPYKPGLSEESIKDKHSLNKVVKLGSNENPYGPTNKIKEIFKNFNNIERYPDNYCTLLRNKLSEKYNISKDNLIFGNGSVEIIQMLARAFIEPDDEVITCIPSFQSYFLETYIESGKMIAVPLTDDYRFDLNGILRSITSKTKMIYITNPNNPTGTIVTNSELKEFLNKVSSNIIVVLDEAYAEFVNDKEYPNSIQLFREYSNLCILKTFSKAYGLASLRIGYGISSKEIISELEKVRLPFNILDIAQMAACIALDDEAHLNNCKKRNREVIEQVYKKLDEYNIEYINTETNFIMIDTKKDCKIVSEKLLQNGFIVRPGFPNMDTFIRVTIGTEVEMKDFVECLNKVLKEN